MTKTVKIIYTILEDFKKMIKPFKQKAFRFLKCVRRMLMNYSKRLLHYVKYVLGMHRFYYFLKIFNDS